MNPKDLKYSKEHEWVRVEAGTAVVGITEFAQDQLGDVVYIDLPAVGSRLQQFSKFGEIESVKSVSELFAPVSGEVLDRNELLSDHPELVNQSPYQQGWMLKVRFADFAELDKLMTADQYETLTKSEE